jgi:hypothetical protein
MTLNQNYFCQFLFISYVISNLCSIKTESVKFCLVMENRTQSYVYLMPHLCMTPSYVLGIMAITLLSFVHHITSFIEVVLFFKTMVSVTEDDLG